MLLQELAARAAASRDALDALQVAPVRGAQLNTEKSHARQIYFYYEMYFLRLSSLQQACESPWCEEQTAQAQQQETSYCQTMLDRHLVLSGLDA